MPMDWFDSAGWMIGGVTQQITSALLMTDYHYFDSKSSIFLVEASHPSSHNPMLANLLAAAELVLIPNMNMRE